MDFKDFAYGVEYNVGKFINSISSLVGSKTPASTEINNITKKVFGFDLFRLSPSDYDTPEQLKEKAVKAIKHGYKEDAIENIKRIKDTQQLEQIRQYLTDEFLRMAKKAPQSPDTFIQMSHLLDIAKVVNPNAEQIALQYLESKNKDYAIALQKAKESVNYLNNVKEALTIATIAFPLGKLATNALLSPIIKNAIAKAVINTSFNSATALSSGALVVAETQDAVNQGRSFLASIADPITLMIGYDAFKSGISVVKQAGRVIAGETLKAGGYKDDLISYYGLKIKNKQQIDKHTQNFTNLSALLEKIDLSQSENLLQQISKQLGTDSSTAVALITAMKKQEANLTAELIEATKYVYNLPEVKQAFINAFKNDKNGIDIIANHAESILLDLAKNNKEVREFIDTQRTASLLHTINKAYNDGASHILLKRVLDDGLEAIDIHNTPFNVIKQRIDKILDDGEHVVFKWTTKDGVERSIVIRPAYLPTYDNFITLKGKFIVSGDNLPFGLTKKEAMDLIKDADDLAIISQLPDNVKIAVIDKPITIPHSIISFGKEGLDAVIKDITKDNTAKILYADYKAILNPHKVFPHKLNRLMKEVKDIAKDVRKLKSGSVDIPQMSKYLEQLGIVKKDEFMKSLADNDINKIKSYIKEDKNKINENLKAVKSNVKDKAKQYAKLQGELEELQTYLEHTKRFKQATEKLYKEGLIKEIPDVINQDTVKAVIKEAISNMRDKVKTARQELYQELENSLKLIKKDLSKPLFDKFKTDLKNIEYGWKEFDELETKLLNIGKELDILKTTPNFEMKREGRGYAVRYHSYDDFVEHISSKTWSRVFADMDALTAVNNVKTFLERLEKTGNLNNAQKLFLEYLRYTEGKTGESFKDALTAVSRTLGAIYTMNSLPIAIGNAIQYMAVSSTLFPSLKFYNPLNLVKYKNEINRAFREGISTEYSAVSFHKLNPIIPFTNAILRASIKASIETQDDLRNVLKDYARLITRNDNELNKVVDDLFEFYKHNPEMLVDDLEAIISAVDPKVLGTLWLKFANNIETVMPWYRFVFTPYTFALESLRQLPKRLESGEAKHIAKTIGISTILATTIGTQAVPYFAPMETWYGITKSLASLLAREFHDEVPEELLQKDVRNASLVFLSDKLNIKELHPADKNYIFENIGRTIVSHIFGSDLRSESLNGDLLEKGMYVLERVIDLTFNSIRSIVSEGAISFGIGELTQLPFITLQAVKNIAQTLLLGERKDTDKADADLLFGIFKLIFPHGRDLVNMVFGKDLAKGLPATIKDYPDFAEKLKVIPESRIYETLGASWLVGFITHFADQTLTRGAITALEEWFNPENTTVPERAKKPSEAPYYKPINLRTTEDLSNPETINYLTAVIKKVDEKDRALLMETLAKKVSRTILGRGKTPESHIKHLYYLSDEDFEKKKAILKNFIEIWRHTQDYWNEDTKKAVEEYIKNLNTIIKQVEEHRKVLDDGT